MVFGNSYGSWQSPITAELLSKSQLRLGAIQSYNHDHYGWLCCWVAGDSEKQGNNILYCYHQNNIIQLSDDDFSIGSRIHEYGGIAYCIGDKGIYCIEHKTQILYLLAFDITQSQPKIAYKKIIYHQDGLSLGQPILRHDDIILIAENTQQRPHENFIATINTQGELTKLVSGHDFYGQLALSPQQDKLAWITWDLPFMPWDNAQCQQGIFDNHGYIIDIKQISPIADDKSVTQIFYDNIGNLYFNCDDEHGLWQLYQYNDTAITPITASGEQREYGKPLWNLGMNNFLMLAQQQIFATYAQQGKWYGHIIAPDNDKQHNDRQLPSDFTSYHSFAVFGDNHIALHVGFADQSDAIILLNIHDFTWHIIQSSSNIAIDKDYISKAQSIIWQSDDGDIVQAYYYAPTNNDYAVDNHILPPLIVKSHGGPTGQTHADFSLAIQFWTSRGFGVCDVNYRGSTGFGRKYREKLYKNWGIFDREDLIAAAKYIVDAHKANGDAIFISGSSAGGYSVLATLTFDNYFRAGCSKYGIGDLSALASDTHKFESGYLDLLIGDIIDDKDIYQQRSPLYHSDQLSCPILFLQGNDDKIVPPNQAQTMIDAMKANNIPYEAIFFDGEGHGFRQGENIIRALEAELAFYQQQLKQG